MVIPLLVPMFTWQRGKQRILSALQSELGRPVSASSVHLRLLPWPGFELDNVQLGDQPAFGLEPMASADEVIATLRLASLWSGRYEFSSVELDSPDLNLTRNAAGYWNFSRLLDRAQRGMPRLEPSGAPASLFQPAPFPYLKIRDGRINFKLNSAKTRFYLSNVQADLSLVNGRWNLQASFAPMRSDLNLADAGQIRIKGWWQSGAARFQNLPFQLRLNLDHAYLPAASALLLGREGPLDGIASARVDLSGNGRGFEIQGATAIRSLRRHDLLPANFPAPLRLQFQANYDPRHDQLFIRSFAPLHSKGFALAGVIQNLFTHPAPILHCTLTDVPLSPLVRWAPAFKAGLPSDLQGSGLISGKLSLEKSLQRWHGQGFVRLRNFRLASRGASLDLPLAIWHWRSHALTLAPASAWLHAGAAAMPLRIHASLDSRGYRLRLLSPHWRRSDMEAVARISGLVPPYLGWLHGEGSAQLNLQSDWTHYRHPVWLGRILLHQGQFRLPYARAAVRLTSARLLYQPAKLRFTLAGVTSGIHVRLLWSRPRHLPGPVSFVLAMRGGRRTDFIHYFTFPRSGWLRNWLRLRPRFLLPDINAAGSVSISRMHWGRHRLSLRSHLAISAKGWHLRNLKLHFAGGEIAGVGDWGSGSCSFSGRMIGLQLGRIWPGLPLLGNLSGRLRLGWPNCRLFSDWMAQGMALVRQIRLPETSLAIFPGNAHAAYAKARLVSASYRASPNSIRLSHVLWLSSAGNFSGTGEWLNGKGWRVELKSGTRRLRLVLSPAKVTTGKEALAKKVLPVLPPVPAVKPKPSLAGKHHVR